MTLTNPIIGTKQEEEWQELQRVLQSGILDKAPNLRNFLEYVAEQHFSGKADAVKEYNIAVQALHRQEQFDPQSDTIVRVTAHTLRKKLEHFYATEGADHPIQIRLPAGKYVLQFDRKEQTILPRTDPAQPLPPLEPSAPSVPLTRRLTRGHTGRVLAYLGIFGAAILVLTGSYFLRNRRPGVAAQLEDSGPSRSAAGPSLADVAGSAPDRAIRIRMGAASHSYTDVAGKIWLADRYCTGGSTFSHPDHEIQGTDDPALFQEGREGKSQCRIPVPEGKYQVELLFADTAGDKEAARQVDISINGTATAALDIVDEAGGDDIAVGKVYAGIHRMSDGTIHLDFTSDGSFINAIELTPCESDAGLPIRMIAGPVLFHDDQGNVWLPERFFQGGRRTFHPDNPPKIPNARLFAWERYGHFHYDIPVAGGRDYTVRLYFSEGWFGVSNGGPGGIGSRVFDVYCNGTTLLKNFDILQSQKGGTAVVTFNRVKPTAHGMLELDFTPVRNYPLINAIEIDPNG